MSPPTHALPTWAPIGYKQPSHPPTQPSIHPSIDPSTGPSCHIPRGPLLPTLLSAPTRLLVMWYVAPNKAHPIAASNPLLDIPEWGRGFAYRYLGWGGGTHFGLLEWHNTWPSVSWNHTPLLKEKRETGASAGTSIPPSSSQLRSEEEEKTSGVRPMFCIDFKGPPPSEALIFHV